jgi:hypothetical protein
VAITSSGMLRSGSDSDIRSATGRNSEEHDVGIEDAIALMRQRDGRRDLQELLDMPAAHRFGPQRPPELAPLALDDARQRPQP